MEREAGRQSAGRSLTSELDDQRLHQMVSFIGMRAQATAVGLIRLCTELSRAEVLHETALERIKDAIAEEIACHCPPSTAKKVYKAEVRQKLDRLFAGDESVEPLPAPGDH